MIRVLSTFCIGLLAFTCTANYRVSEQTRVARQELVRTEKQIKAESQNMSVLEAQWQKIASPDAIQKLAENSLGMQNAPSVQLASVHDLPRRGADTLNNEAVHSASADGGAVPVPVLKATMRSGM
jgi:cell division protein FtsL